MSFLFPAELTWAWLLLPLLLLFLVRRPPRQRRVPSLLLFRLLAAHRIANPANPRRRWLAFLLAVTTLLLVVTALTGPVFPPEASGQQVQRAARREVPARLRLEALPTPSAPRVLWVRTQEDLDPFTALALSALNTEGSIVAFEHDPSSGPLDLSDFDLLLLDGWLPPAWPKDVPLLILNPPHRLGPLDLAPIAGPGLRVERLHGIDASHPVLRSVASERVTLMQTSVLAESPSLPALWTGPAGPLLLAGQRQGRRVVVLPFAPARSERLGLLGAYPVLLGNALAWLSEQGSGRPRPDGSASSAVDTLTGVALATPDPLNRGPLFALLLQLTLCLLVLEAWLYHRHAVS